jgi:integrase
MFEFAVNRKYTAENPAAGVKHFDERRERPSKRMLTVDGEQRILCAARPHLRVAIVLLVQTGGRTYSEGFSLRWEQLDLENSVIHLDGDVKASESAQPVPLSRLACEVLREWRKDQGPQALMSFRAHATRASQFEVSNGRGERLLPKPAPQQHRYETSLSAGAHSPGSRAPRTSE